MSLYFVSLVRFSLEIATIKKTRDIFGTECTIYKAKQSPYRTGHELRVPGE